MVDYVVKVRKDDATVVGDVVSAIENSNGTFGQFTITSVEKTGTIVLSQGMYLLYACCLLFSEQDLMNGQRQIYIININYCR